jgi:hypothetical protein
MQLKRSSPPPETQKLRPANLRSGPKILLFDECGGRALQATDPKRRKAA